MKMPQLEASATSGDVIPLPESKMLAKLPNVAELLLVPTWEDGPHKGKRCAMLFFEGSICKLLVKLEGQRLKTMVSARGFDEVWAGLEVLLKGGNVPWEQEQDEKPSGQKKRK